MNEFADVAMSFVGMLANEVVPKLSITLCPNQKLWVHRSIHAAVNARTAAYNIGLIIGNMSAYKEASYGAQ